MRANLRILFACGESTRSDALAVVLEANAGVVERVADVAQATAARDADILVVDEFLADHASGLDLCEALRNAGVSLPFVLMARNADFELCRRAYRLGAVDVVGHFDPEQLVRAITGVTAVDDIRDGSCRRHEQRYTANEFAVRRALQDLTAFLEVGRVAPAHAARIACAAAEVLDNVHRHAYGHTREHEAGAFSVQADLRRASVRLTIRDFGSGFDLEAVRLDSVPAPLPGPRRLDDEHVGGLVRASRLSEALKLDSGADGSTVELTFELTLSAIGADTDSDRSVSSSDFHPGPMRSLVASLRQGTAPWDQVPSALTLTLDRLLGGARVSRQPVASR
jgi:anti-sigma regulatory factor (Ser/Thr protein kinase)/CheY-like chemotaxis protein